jgi:hypothetical protein
MDAKTKAGEVWFGYGRWAAPYWFVGMEPGGSDDHASYESWLRLGGGELIDCRAHHLDSNAHAPAVVTEWHRDHEPPTQSTWRKLIQMLMAYEAKPTDMDTVREYQRVPWGSIAGETALIELSSLHAPSLAAEVVGRTSHRKDRIALIKRRMEENQPKFALFYGTGYREEYEKIVGGTFDANGGCWSGNTLCVLARHPIGVGAPGEDFWIDLGRRVRATVDGGSGTALASTGE